MKILLAGPGTGKTTKIGEIIDGFGDGQSCIVLSFTNATIKDLLKDLASKGVSQDNCMTLHKFAVKYNHDFSRHVLERPEEEILMKISKATGITFPELCDPLRATTFEQMIERFVTFAQSNETYLQEILKPFNYLIVDEYQDFNPGEQALVDVLLPYFNEAIILGDDDQCIYGFKDASSEKIIELFEDDTHEKIQHEHKCYRCPDKVVEYASNLIKNNTQRVDKDWLKNGNEGEVLYTQVEDISSAAEHVVRNIQEIQAQDSNASIFVLSPIGFISEPVKQALSNAEIEFENSDAPKVTKELIEKSWEVKALFGEHTYLNLLFLAYRNLTARKPLYELVTSHLRSGLNSDELLKLVAKKLPPEMSGLSSLEEMLALENYADIKELYENAEGKTDAEKLENLFIKKEESQEEKKVKCMSIHKSKGLGAEYVFILGLTEGILPNQKQGSDSIEAQRRLLFVGMTRAKKWLSLVAILRMPGSLAHRLNMEDFKFDYKKRLYTGRASRFIEELNLPREVSHE